MIVAISSFTISNNDADAIAARFGSRSRKVDRHRGFLGLEVLRRKSGSITTFMLITRWISREALRSYLRSDDFRIVHADSREQQAEFAVYEVVAD